MSKKNEDKEEKVLNTWIPLGVMIGTVIGVILSLVNDNFIYLGICSTAGLAAGISLGLLKSKDIIIKIKK